MGWLSGWDKRIKLTIDQTKVDVANQSNFPVLVYLSASSGITSVDVSCVFDELTSDGNRKKIAVTTSDGTTECYVEIERWDDANEKAWLWVKVPTVTHAVDTDIYIYYDKDHADNTTHVGDTTDAITYNVWDSNFVCVLHMAQDPNGDIADAIKDSTSNANHATPKGSMTTADLVDGQIGKAIDFEGTDDYLEIIDNASLSITGNITLEGLIKSDVAQGASIRQAIDKPYAYSITFDHSAAAFRGIVAIRDTSPAWKDGGGPIAISDSVYHSFGGLYDGTHLRSYLDGAESVNNNIGAVTIFDSSNPVNIGKGDDFFNGIIDELRISDTNRSEPWLKATHHSNVDTLITFGSEEQLATNLFDGKLAVSPKIDLFDGKARIKSEATDLLDGLLSVENQATNLLDGKTLISYTGQINDRCPTPICEISAVFRYVRLQASSPVPEASFTVGKIIAGDLSVPDFTCIAYHGRNPSLIANSPCPTCSMRVGLSLNDIATISQKAGVPIPSCIMSADTHHLVTIYGDMPCPVITCDGDTVNITVISASVPVSTGLFETTIGNVVSILGRSPCPSCSLTALTGQVISLAGSVPVPGSLVRFYASLKNETITLTGTAPTPGMISKVYGLTSSVLRHIRGEVR